MTDPAASAGSDGATTRRAAPRNAADPAVAAVPPQLLAVLEGRLDAAWRLPDGVWVELLAPPPRALLSGSFNPRHAGHVALRAAATEWLQADVHYELPVWNADKPRLELPFALQRCIQFTDAPVVVTRAATFAAKARLFPAAVFVVGADTAVRVLDERFYTGQRGGLRAALHEIRSLGCRFLVAARMCGEQLLTAAALSPPAGFADLFEVLPEHRFRHDLSSSELRKPSEK